MLRFHRVPTWSLLLTAAFVSCDDGRPSTGWQLPDATIDGGEGDADADVNAGDVAPDAESDAPADVAVDGDDAGDGSGDATDVEEDADTDASELCGLDHCEIDGECYENETPNPENPCEICLVISAVNQWSNDDTASCDDESLCTSDDFCSEGVCVGTPVACEDGNDCTVDSCDPLTGTCSSESREGSCTDFDRCTLGDSCIAGTCTPGGDALPCDDGNPCTVESCDPERGCVSEPLDGVACDDGDPCSVGDVCTVGFCEAGTERLSCDDGSLCTLDRCVPGVGCEAISIADRCVDDNPCTDEACDPLQGCVFPFNSDPCDDGSACTLADICLEGACRGTALAIDDLNVCTDDSCDPETGAVYFDNTEPCDDGNFCTVGDVCADGGCEPGAEPLTCDDTNFCTDDSCAPSTGCVFTPHTRSCDDNNACTFADTCGDGDCEGQPVDCDDNNACTIDTCNVVNGCANTLIVSNACRPEILVDFPARAATIVAPGANVVNVRGRVRSGAGPITSLTLNGAELTLTPDDANPGWLAFSTDDEPFVGSNVLSFLATDSFETTREVVQSYHWARDYQLAEFADPTSGFSEPGLSLWLGQNTLDDGVAPPPQDFAAIFNQVISGLDLSTLFDPNAVLASQAGYNIYLRSLGYATSTVSLQAIDGGIRIVARLNTIRGRLRFDCTNFTCFLLGGSGGGSIAINYVEIQANLLISARPDRTLQVTVENPTTVINGLNVSADNGFTNFLLGIVETFIRDSLVSDLEDTLNNELSGTIGPLLEDALSALALNLAFDLPRLDDPAATIPVALQSDFSATDFQDAAPGPQGGAIILRARSTTPVRGVPAGAPFDLNLGTPQRQQCGLGSQPDGLLRSANIELAFPDDTLNGILRAAWWGGFLSFAAGPSLLGDVDLAAFGVTNLELQISGWLPPLASDCAPGSSGLTLYIGDLRIDASLTLFGTPVAFVVYVALAAPISLQAGEGQIEIIVEEIQSVELQVDAADEASVPFEDAVATLLEAQLVPALGGLLGGGEPLAGFPLPEIDLSESVGAPAGTVLIAIEPSVVVRVEGNTLIQGALR